MRAVSISMVVCYLYMQTCNIIVTDSPRRLVISAYYTYVIIIVVVSVAVFVIVLVYALTFIIRYMYLYYCHHAKQRAVYSYLFPFSHARVPTHRRCTSRITTVWQSKSMSSMSHRKRKFEEDIQRMLWKIRMDELSFKTSAESVRLFQHVQETKKFTPHP